MIFLAIQARTTPGRATDWLRSCHRFLAGGPGELQPVDEDNARIFFHPLADGIEIPIRDDQAFEVLLVTSGVGPGLHEEVVAWLDDARQSELLVDVSVDDSTGYWIDRDRANLERMHVKVMRQIDEALQQECEGMSVQTSLGRLTPSELSRQIEDLIAYRDLAFHFPWWSRERNGWLWFQVGRAVLAEWMPADENDEPMNEAALRLADRALRRARAHGIRPTDCLELLARVAERRADWQTAREALEEILSRRPEEASLHARLGLALWNLDQPDLAWRCFDRALHHDPEMHRVRFNRALAEARLGRPGDALLTLKRFLREQPDDWDGRIEQAALLLELDRGEAALDILEQLAEERPNEQVLFYLRGRALRSLGRWHEAIDAFESAGDTKDYDLLLERGECYRSLGLPAEALADFRSALARDPLRPEAFRNAALALEALGEVEAAEKYRRCARDREKRPGSSSSR